MSIWKEGLFGEKFRILNYNLMKRLIIIILAFAFLGFSCGTTTKTNNIHVSHSKEKDQYKKPADKKYTTSKKSNKSKKK